MEKQSIKNLKKNIDKIKNIEVEQQEAILHALVDIKDSLETIYNKIIPKLIKNELTEEEIKDLLWDIREEIRHIDYHIHDSQILDL